MGHWIIAPITFGVGRITKEDASEGVWREHVRGGGGDVRVTKTRKDKKLIIRGRGAEEKLVVCIVPARTAWMYVNKKM